MAQEGGRACNSAPAALGPIAQRCCERILSRSTSRAGRSRHEPPQFPPGNSSNPPRPIPPMLPSPRKRLRNRSYNRVLYLRLAMRSLFGIHISHVVQHRLGLQVPRMQLPVLRVGRRSAGLWPDAARCPAGTGRRGAHRPPRSPAELANAPTDLISR